MNNLRILACLGLLLSFGSLAEQHSDDPEDYVTVGEWEFAVSIGLGQRSNPLLRSDDIPLLLLPRIRYYGERWFLENLEFGYTLSDQPSLMVNAIATPGYDRLFFYRWDPSNFFIDIGGVAVDPTTNLSYINLAGLSTRRLAYLAGVELSGGIELVEWQLQMLHDVTGVHDGSEIRLGFALNLDAGSWRNHIGAGATWKSEALVDYYYGIRQSEVTNGRHFYQGRATLNPYFKIAMARPINEHWLYRMHLHYESLGSGITDSPIVQDDYVLTVFIGGDYHF